MISLPVSAGVEPRQVTVMVDFLVLDKQSAYSIILGHPTLNALKAVVSTIHLAMKFPTEHGVEVVRGNQETAQICYNAMLKEPRMKEALSITMEVHDERSLKHGEPVEELIELPMDGSKRTLKIGSQLSQPVRENLIRFLKENLDVFAWMHKDMPGIGPSVITHRLNLSLNSKPVIQKKRYPGPERSRVATEEVDKLLKEEFIRDVQYPAWISNLVMVKRQTENG